MRLCILRGPAGAFLEVFSALPGQGRKKPFFPCLPSKKLPKFADS